MPKTLRAIVGASLVIMGASGLANAQDRAASNPPELRVLRGPAAQAFVVEPHLAPEASSQFAAIASQQPAPRIGKGAATILHV